MPIPQKEKTKSPARAKVRTRKYLGFPPPRLVVSTYGKLQIVQEAQIRTWKRCPSTSHLCFPVLTLPRQRAATLPFSSLERGGHTIRFSPSTTPSPVLPSYHLPSSPQSHYLLSPGLSGTEGPSLILLNVPPPPPSITRVSRTLCDSGNSSDERLAAGRGGGRGRGSRGGGSGHSEGSQGPCLRGRRRAQGLSWCSGMQPPSLLLLLLCHSVVKTRGEAWGRGSEGTHLP